jgi:hypothetical protein
MHNPAAHSAVSEALIDLANSAPAADALQAGREAVARARQRLASAGDAERLVAKLPGYVPDWQTRNAGKDARLRAWCVGTVLALHDSASVQTPAVAAAIAMGERLGVSDDEMAAAAAVGAQASQRVLAAIDSDAFRERWNVASVVGIVGATLAVARLLGLDRLRTRHALGVAATQAAGLARNVDEPMGAVETGKAAADAVEAALLAKHGFTSAAASIDGRRGLAALMAYRFDADAILASDNAH